MGYTFEPNVRFFEVDQQRVIYHMWYLAYFEDARNDMFADWGMPLRQIMSGGHDVQIVHYEIDWKGPITWDDALAVDVAVEGVGRKSFTLAYTATVEGVPSVSARAVYVMVSMDARRRTVAVPPFLRRALEAHGDRQSES